MLARDVGVEVLRIRREHHTRPAEQARDDLIDGLLRVEHTARTHALDPVVPIVLAMQSQILLSARRPEEALAAAERGAQSLKTGRDRQQATELFTAHAEALAALGRWKDTAVVCRQGIEIVERQRRRVSPLTLASAYLGFRARLYELAVHAAVVENDLAYALSVSELVKSRSLTNLRRAPSETTARLWELQQEFREICRVMDSSDPTSEELNVLRAKRGALWDLMTIERLRSRDMKGADFSVAAVQNTLSADEAALYYFWIGQAHLLIAALDAERTHARIEPVAPDERQALMTLSQAVLTFGQNSTPGSVAPGKALTDLLIPPWARALLAGKRRLLISPHRMLHSLPFHALVIEGKYLIQHYAVTYVPNLTSLLWSLPGHARANVLLVAAPSYEGPERRDFPYLAGAIAEVKTLEASYKSAHISVRTLSPEDAEDATESALLALDTNGELQRFSLLHFACHGRNVDESLPMESKLYLRDSALDGLEIANWNLRADLVILSACASGQRPIGGRDFVELPGDDLFGLQAAFFIAGARQIVSALWPVEDWAARDICVSFHAHLARMSPDLALQRALSDFMDSAGPLSSEPVFWAPFFLVRAAGTQGGSFN